MLHLFCLSYQFLAKIPKD